MRTATWWTSSRSRRQIEITCNTINAGIYVLEPETLERIPKDTAFSIERGYFPSLVRNGETFVALVSHGYWIDIGTPEKYRQAHRDIMDGRFVAPPFEGAAGQTLVSPEARVDDGARLEGPCFVDRGAVVKRGARIGPYSVIGPNCHIDEEAVVDGGILWANTWVDRETRLGAVLAGGRCHFGRNVQIGDAVLGDMSVVTDYSSI